MASQRDEEKLANHGVDGNRDLLEELSSVEDDFDVDLMACGCRLRRVSEAKQGFAIEDIVRLYNLDEKGVEALIGALIDEGKIDPDRVFELAESAARGTLKEKASHFAVVKKKKNDQ